MEICQQALGENTILSNDDDAHFSSRCGLWSRRTLKSWKTFEIKPGQFHLGRIFLDVQGEGETYTTVSVITHFQHRAYSVIRSDSFMYYTS